MKQSSSQKSISEYGNLIETRLNHLITEKDVPYNTLLKAARYSLLASAKRLRPILALATAETLGVHRDQALDPACALEMIQTYSLIHDDLPCMDDDDFRRGKPSLHKAFSESHAVLAGDFLLTFSFEVIANAPFQSPQQKVELINLLAKNCGVEGMIGGQIMDMESEDKSIQLEHLREMHERKTGALILASIEFGAIVANATELYKSILREFGKEIGLAFQMIDDILDVKLNKNSDQKNKKATYVTLLSLEKAEELAHAHYTKALHVLKKLPHNTELLSSLSELMVNRSK